MNDYQLLTRLAEANAYREGTPLPETIWNHDLALFEIERRMGMEPGKSTNQPTITSDEPQREETRRPPVPGRTIETKQTERRPGRFIVGAAAAVLVLVAGLGMLAVLGGDKDAAVEPEVAVVLSAIEAVNRGDIDTYMASLTGEELTVETNVRVAEALSFANRTIELFDCRVTGKAPTGESIVECESTETDDFRSAGGIVESGTATFLVTEDDKISSRESGDADLPWEDSEFGMFNSAFWSWLRDAHPAVFDDISPPPASLDSIPGLNYPAAFNFGVEDLHEADEMLVALEYVGEFVAQSDVYPINP